ncbi:MAG: Unknown protein [uncultured Aureispira sp.]|uniref:Glycosyltransferase RgtA/B/C/D-like domain-containing protein n=1 Tax=uncultured Aureispira sp. TaxID=1331704 RepID=A0A6S6UK06_9BACT|nr:MAG: Unknown protein [uncultured Aureispira sp.]
MSYQTDSSSFIHAVELLLGESSPPDRLFRRSKPLSLLLPAFLYLSTDLSIQYGFWVQQFLAYWLSALFLYKIIAFISSKDFFAYLAMLAYVLCQPMAVYGLAVLTDGLGWCWMLIGIWISLKTISSSTLSIFNLAILGIFMGLGLFIKESILVTGIFTFFLLLIHPNHSLKARLIGYSVVGSFFLSTFFIGNYLTDLFWGISIFDWVKFGQSDPPPFSWSSFIIQSYHTIDLYWFLFIIGFYKSISSRKWSPVHYALCLTFISGWILLPLFWPYLYDRILFMMAPFIMLWVAIGASHFKALALPLVVFAGCTNLLVAFFIYKYQISGLITSSAFLFCLLLLLAHVLKDRQVLDKSD